MLLISISWMLLLLVLLSSLSGSCCRVFGRAAVPSVITTQARSSSKRSSSDIIGRVSLAGGLAGGITVTILQPLDTLKTMCQSDHSVRTIWDAVER